jgi:hypothetical protein
MAGPLANRRASHYTLRTRSALRRDAGAVERGGLENRCTRERTVGSNPTPSATQLENSIAYGHHNRSTHHLPNKRPVGHPALLVLLRAVTGAGEAPLLECVDHDRRHWDCASRHRSSAGPSPHRHPAARKATTTSVFRILPMSTTTSYFCYQRLGLLVAWFAFGKVTLVLLGTLGFSPDARDMRRLSGAGPSPPA